MESTGKRLVLYTRVGGRLPPRDRERLEIFDDGEFDMWRSVGAASQPASPVGLFRGKVSEGMFNELWALVQAADAAGDLAIKPPPDSSIDTIQLPHAQARLGRHAEPEGAWGYLAQLLRECLGALASHAFAALSMEVAPSGDLLYLRHQGTQPLSLDLGKLQVRAVLWQQRTKKGDWRMANPPATLPGRMEVGPGWEYELPIGHGFTVLAGQCVAAYVTLTLYDGKLPVMVALEARSQVFEPMT